VKAAFDVLAHHPINTSGGPTTSAIHPNDASTPDFKKVVKTLRAAERQNTVATGGRHPAWATELWWDSDPPDNVEGVPLKTQARYLEQALYILWKQGARVVINLQIVDSPFDSQNPFENNSTGLFFARGSPKPALTAFRFPFVTARGGGAGTLEAWGRPPAAGRLRIERRARGGWRRVKSVRVQAGNVFRTRLKLHGKQRLRAQVSGERSLVWRQG
jgi:hypothetical protein